VKKIRTWEAQRASTERQHRCASLIQGGGRREPAGPDHLGTSRDGELLWGPGVQTWLDAGPPLEDDRELEVAERWGAPSNPPLEPELPEEPELVEEPELLLEELPEPELLGAALQLRTTLVPEAAAVFPGGFWLSTVDWGVEQDGSGWGT